MLGAQEDLRGSVVLGDHLLRHVHAPVRLLHSEIKLDFYKDNLILFCGRHK